jgi:hypothetical protein
MGIRKILVLVGLVLTFIPGASRADNIPPGKYYIQSALEYKRSNKGFWDLKGKNPKITQGMEIKVWELSDRAGDRQYSFKPASHPNGVSYYEILVSNIGDARVGVHKGQKKNILKGKDKISKGALVLEKAASADNQLFFLHHFENGEFVIKTFDSRHLQVQDKAKNGGAIIAKATDKADGFQKQDFSARWVLINVDTNEAYVPTASKKLAE